MRPVTQTWTHDLPLMQQAVLLGAIRGPDGSPKYGPVKLLVRWYRRAVLLSSFDGEAILNPWQTDGGSFYGPSIRKHPSLDIFGALVADGRFFDTWQEAIDNVVDQYLRDLDALPHHFQLHLMHAAEIVGYKHPQLEVRVWWRATYERLVHDMHVWPETEEQLDHRLSDTRRGWLARADRATVD